MLNFAKSMEVYFVKFIFAFVEYRANHDVKLAIIVYKQLHLSSLNCPLEDKNHQCIL